MSSVLLSLFTRGRNIPNKGFKVLTGKQHPRYYKGRGATKTGIHTTKGRFLVLESMLPKYVVPSLEGFTLTPYVEDRPPLSPRKKQKDPATETALVPVE